MIYVDISAAVHSRAGLGRYTERLASALLAEHPERARYWFWYAEYLNDYYPGRGEEARGALLKASRPGGKWEVSVQELKELHDHTLKGSKCPRVKW